LSQHLKATVACDADHDDDEEEEEEDDSEDEMVEEDEEEEEEEIEFEVDDANDEEFELITSNIKSNTESNVYIEDEEEEDDDEEEEDEEEEDEVDTEEEVEQEKEEEEETEEDEEEEEEEVQFQGNENDETGEEESEDFAEEENEDEELMATFVGSINPNFLTLHKYRAKGHGRVCFTPKGGKSMLFDMCDEKDVEIMRNLMKNPPEGTTWRVLRGDTEQKNKSQKPGRSCAPGFITASDDDSSVKPGSVKVDDTTKRQERKVATKGGVNARKAASKESTTANASSSKKMAKSTKKPATNTNQKTAQTTATQAEVCANFSAEEAVSNKSAGPKQGKTNLNQRNDSDDDSLDLGDVEGMRVEMAKLAQDVKPKKRLGISVSPPLANVADGCTKYVVSFPRRGTVFYAKAGCLQGIIALAHKQRKLVNPNEDGSWIQSISSYNLRDKEFGEASSWLKTTNGNTIDVIYFIVSVPIGEANAFESTLKAQLKYFFDVTRKRKTHVTGRLVLDYCQDLPQGRKGGLGKYCLNKGTTKKGTSKEVVSESKAVEVMTQELHDHFKDGYTVNYDVPLNKFMVDWDIKEFVKTYVGVNSWDDLTEDDKRKCYRDYPKKSLPDWDEIAQESY
jgi:chemotaxis protein histidine kinase CheA